jgi:hypothetical protein
VVAARITTVSKKVAKALNGTEMDSRIAAKEMQVGNTELIIIINAYASTIE